MGYLEGLLGGFVTRKGEVEKQNRDDQAAADRREEKLLLDLSNSPDPEIRAHGIAGLLDTANPRRRKGGLRGWLGEMQSNPHMDAIRAIAAADSSRFAGTHYDEYTAGGQVTTPPGAQPAAQPSTSPTTGGPPPRPEPSLNKDVEGRPQLPSGAMTGLARNLQGEPTAAPGGMDLTPEGTPDRQAPTPDYGGMSDVMGVAGARARPQAPAVVPGNVDLQAQPVVQNPDGTTSTVDTVGVNIDGREVNLPRVTPDGRHLTTEEAIAEYQKTGRHLGQFSTQEDAASAAGQLHEDYASGAVGAPPPAGGPAGPQAVLGQAAAPPLANQTAPPPSVVAPGQLRRNRQFFQTPEGQVRLNELARTQAGIEGMRIELKAAGFSDAEIREILKQHFARQYGSGLVAQSIAGEAPDATGVFHPAFGIFDRLTRKYVDTNGQPIVGFRPKSSSTSTYHYGTELEAATMRMFNVSYGAATPDQRNAAEQEVEAKAGRTQVQRVNATNQGKLDAPIGVTNALRYPGVPATATLRELAGRVPLSQQDLDKVGGIQVLEGTLNEVEALLPKVFPDVGSGIGGRVATALSLFGQSAGRQEDITKLNAAIASTQAAIVRANGVTQRLNQKELDLAAKQMVNTSVIHGDTLESAQAKMEILRDLLKRVTAAGPSPVPAPGAPGQNPPPAASPAPGPGVKPGTPPPAAATPVTGAGGVNPATTPSVAYQDAQGNWHIGTAPTTPQLTGVKF